MRHLLPILALWAVCGFALRCGAQQPAPGYTRREIPAVRTVTPPVIDGDLSDAAWKSAPKAETFVDRQYGRVQADQTTAWILYDDKYIYVAFYAHESRPESITARETIRDYRYQGNFDYLSEDSVEVNFDPFRGHSPQDHSYFALNAIGTRSVSLGGGRGGKREWKGDWDGAVKRVADGWTAEMRIPWGILNYPSSKQPVTFDINFSRVQSRTRIESVWSNIGPQQFYELDGLWTGVVPPPGAFHPHVSVLPYTIPGLYGTRPTLRSGMDARYTITPELTAVGSLNPDFGTIEGAVEGIQFSRSERFVPERRPFFLEGGDLFNISNVNIIGAYFYSNRIRTFDLGTKLYGKLSPTDTLGLLHTVEFFSRDDVVARYRHDFTPTSSGGFFFMQKSAVDDNNTLAQLNQSSRWGKLLVDSKWNLSTGRSAGGGAEELALLYLDKRMTWAIGGANVSPLFRDADGLIGFTDYRGPIAQLSWNAEWRKGYWRRFNFQITPVYFWHTDGRPFQRGGDMNLNFDTRSDWDIGLTANHTSFDDQTDATWGLSVTHGVSNRFRQWGIYVQTGRQGGSPSTFLGPSFSYRLFRKLDVSYAGAVLNLDGVTQQHVATLSYEISPSRSIGGRAVVQGADTNWYLSYRSSGERGTETYFIVGDPNTPRFSRQVRVKLVFSL